MTELDQRYESAITNGEYDLGMELAIEQAKSRGYSILAFHGSYNKFNEFKHGDIGFHFSKDIGLAINRLSDKWSEVSDELTHEDEIVYKVVLSIENPYVIPVDFGNWDANTIYKIANLKVSNIPFESPSVMYLTEQRQLARYAWNFLKTIGVTKDEVVSKVDEFNLTSGDSFYNLNSKYTQDLKRRTMASGYDAIIYKNDYEPINDDDPTSYIVFESNQVKSIEPVFDSEHRLVNLSSRFVKESLIITC